MFFIQGQNIGFKYEERRDPIFSKINFTLDHHSRVGLIGNNGTGKSTLLKILAGIIDGFDGSITNQNRFKAGYLPQEAIADFKGSSLDFIWQAANVLLNQVRQQLILEPENGDLWSEYSNLDGFEFELQITKWLDRFLLNESITNQPFEHLSGGEKTKLSLIRVLLTEPEWLLLDEPTNHLDEKHLDWLKEFLIATKLPYLIISHDRNFLDHCTKTIWELNRGSLTSYSGNYSLYKEEKEDEFNRKQLEYKQAKRKISSLKESLQMLKQGAETHQPSTGIEGNSVTYNCVTNLAKYAMQRAKNMEHRVNKMIDKAEEEKPFIEKSYKVIFQETNRDKRTVLTAKNISFAFGKEKLLNDFNLKLSLFDKISITGANGCGKSTLLKIIVGQITNFTGELVINNDITIGYYAQEYENLSPEKTILEEVIMGDNLKQTIARTILGSLKIKEELVNSKISTLSCGEKSKTALAKLLVSNPDLLILDEPTNHLEIEARENLEKALKNYTGTLLLVCHDRQFRTEVTNVEISLDK